MQTTTPAGNAKLGILEVSATKGNEQIKGTIDLDKLAAVLTADGQAFRNVIEMASTAAFHRNGEGWKQLKVMTGEEWLVWSAKPSIRVIAEDKDKAAAQWPRLAPELKKQTPEAVAAFWVAAGLKPATSEAEMAVSFALQRAEIAEKALMAKIAEKEKQAAAMAALLGKVGGKQYANS